MAKKVQVSEQILDEMHEHALADFPNECVGFFFGNANENEKKIVEYQPLKNNKEGDQRRRFAIDPVDYMKAEKYALKNNQTLLGIFHSHPLHPAIPSKHDLAQAVPFFSYIIASVNAAKVENTTSWQLNTQNEFEQEQINN